MLDDSAGDAEPAGDRCIATARSLTELPIDAPLWRLVGLSEANSHSEMEAAKDALLALLNKEAYNDNTRRTLCEQATKRLRDAWRETVSAALQVQAPGGLGKRSAEALLTGGLDLFGAGEVPLLGSGLFAHPSTTECVTLEAVVHSAESPCKRIELGPHFNAIMRHIPYASPVSTLQYVTVNLNQCRLHLYTTGTIKALGVSSQQCVSGIFKLCNWLTTLVASHPSTFESYKPYATLKLRGVYPVRTTTSMRCGAALDIKRLTDLYVASSLTAPRYRLSLNSTMVSLSDTILRYVLNVYDTGSMVLDVYTRDLPKESRTIDGVKARVDEVRSYVGDYIFPMIRHCCISRHSQQLMTKRRKKLGKVSIETLTREAPAS